MLDNMGVERGTICIENIEIGMTRHLGKTVEDWDIRAFVSTDHNPVHLTRSTRARPSSPAGSRTGC